MQSISSSSSSLASLCLIKLCFVFPQEEQQQQQHDFSTNLFEIKMLKNTIFHHILLCKLVFNTSIVTLVKSSPNNKNNPSRYKATTWGPRIHKLLFICGLNKQKAQTLTFSFFLFFLFEKINSELSRMRPTTTRY